VTGKTVKNKSSLNNGQKVSVTTEDILNPDGSRDVTETVNEGGKVSTNKYKLGPGEKREQLTEGQKGQTSLKN